MFQEKTDIPSSISVNYHNADEICGYQLLLCKMLERERGLDYPAVSNRVTAAIIREGVVWLREVRKAIKELLDSTDTPIESGLTLADMPAILVAYDFFHRVCNGFPCDDFIRETVTRCADRYARGDKSISQAQMALMVQREVEKNIRTIDKRYYMFSGRVMEKWIRSLERWGRLSDISESDVYDILKFLLTCNLSAFGVKRDDKLRWIESYTLTQDELDALATETLWSYIGFNQTAEFITRKSLDEQDESYVSLFTRLTVRADLHPFFKEAIAIDLAKYQTA